MDAKHSGTGLGPCVHEQKTSLPQAGPQIHELQKWTEDSLLSCTGHWSHFHCQYWPCNSSFFLRVARPLCGVGPTLHITSGKNRCPLPPSPTPLVLAQYDDGQLSRWCSPELDVSGEQCENIAVVGGHPRRQLEVTCSKSSRTGIQTKLLLPGHHCSFGLALQPPTSGWETWEQRSKSSKGVSVFTQQSGWKLTPIIRAKTHPHLFTPLAASFPAQESPLISTHFLT